MKKIFIIIVLAILLVVGVFVYEQKQKAPTIINKSKTQEQVQTNFIQYKNDVHPYTFSYPLGAVIKSYSETNTNISFTDLFRDSSLKSDFSVNLNESSYSFKDGDNIKNWWIDHGPENGRQAPYPDEEKTITVGGEDAYYTVYDTESDAFGYKKLAAVFIYVAHNGKVYEISGGTLPAHPEARGLTSADIAAAQSYQKIFDQILQSFKFTDSLGSPTSK